MEIDGDVVVDDDGGGNYEGEGDGGDGDDGRVDDFDDNSVNGSHSDDYVNEGVEIEKNSAEKESSITEVTEGEMMNANCVCDVVNYFCIVLTKPLYPGAPISIQASWFACIYFSTKNHLSDAATKELLDLIAIHCPETNNCAKSTYVLHKKKMVDTESAILTFCTDCFNEIKDSKKCSNDTYTKAAAAFSYLTFLPFEKHLINIFTGTVEECIFFFE